MPTGDGNPPDLRSQTTNALSRLARDEPGASDDLLALVYDELRRMARSQLAKMRAGQTLQATSLVHEAWIRLGAGENQDWDGRAHFFGAAARAMRNILLDRVRARGRLKRGGGAEAAELHTGIADDGAGLDVDILALDEALQQLEVAHAQPAKIVSLRYFAGLTVAEVAEVLGTSKRSVERDWHFARTWLRRQLGDAANG